MTDLYHIEGDRSMSEKPLTSPKIEYHMLWTNGTVTLVFVPGKGLEWLKPGCWPGPSPELVKAFEFAARLELEAAARPELSAKLRTMANEVVMAHDAEIRKILEPAILIHG
jgi:hypothetical protein